jgi:hypothetical protein
MHEEDNQRFVARAIKNVGLDRKINRTTGLKILTPISTDDTDLKR